jgi:hypothetical protein
MSFISQIPINTNCRLLSITFILSGIAIRGLYIERRGIGVAQQIKMLQRDLRMDVFKLLGTCKYVLSPHIRLLFFF